MATELSLGEGGPPLTYRLDEVSVRLTRHSGNPALPIRRVILSGTGGATLERDGERMQFSYGNRELLALLNALYKIRFFDLPSQYNTRYSVFLKDDGTVGTEALRMPDSASTSICFAVSGYEKCVTYGRNSPLGLEGIAKQVFSDAGRLASDR
ncbi:hypothetical protein [Nitrosospira sp. Nl5]|uniref:hypothetical protein n=1 Tax=Nitrosospira sp. Nl5 TaxID=200120 RepID=UPI000B87600D|nr:hypothetical protein [Nitrosospira sp. Nl5]